jgi:hypothetical protein
MPDRSLKGILELFERQAEDELNLLSDTGPEFFTTPHLLRLRGQWEVKNTLFQFFQQITMLVVAVSPIWIVLALLLLWLKWLILALAIALLFPLSFVFYFLGLWFMQKVFRGRGHLEVVGRVIGEELERRRKR